jgi:Xaa-Pro dipeptidase
MYFPAEEYEARLSQIRAAMAERKLDLLLQYGQEAVCWASGFYTPAYFAYAALGIPLEGKPFLVLRFMEVPAAETNAWETDLLSYNDDEDPILLTKRAVEGRALGGATIGLDKHSWYLTAERYEKLVAALPSATFHHDGHLIDNIRVKKSPREIEYLRQAARIVEAGLQAAVDATAEGATERDIAAAMAYARLRAGSDPPVDGVLTTGERTMQGHGPWTDRRLVRGDRLYYEFHGIRNHYWARMLRSGILGEPTEKQSRVARTIVEAQDAGLSAIRPGVPAATIDKLCREPLIAAGLKQQSLYTNRVGYALGLNFRPSPGEFIREFTPSADFILEEGMVFHMIQSAAGLGFSDTIAITADGFEFITKYPRKLFVR